MVSVSIHDIDRIIYRAEQPVYIIVLRIFLPYYEELLNLRLKQDNALFLDVAW